MKYNPDIIKSNRKTVSIEVSADGKVTLRVPERMTYREIEKFVESRSAWIEKTLARYNNLTDTDLVPFTDEELSQMTLKAKLIIPPRVEYYAKLMDVSYNKVSVRTVKTRWGSCSSSKNLSFNSLLVLTPPEVMDSVIVHELCHLKEMNHSKRFYNEIYKVMPDYDKYEAWLKSNSIRFIGRLKK
jgi:hypothetical protein